MTWNRWSHSSICNKNDANNIFSGWYKIGFEIKNEIEGQGQSSPKFPGILRVLRCIIGPNLEILSWIGAEWWHGQAQNMAIFYFEVKFDLEVQGQLPPKTIGILTKVFCSSSPNLVILAWTGDKLSHGQASDYRTHRRTHRQTQATTIPEGQNWPRVKTQVSLAAEPGPWACRQGLIVRSNRINGTFTGQCSLPVLLFFTTLCHFDTTAQCNNETLSFLRALINLISSSVWLDWPGITRKGLFRLNHSVSTCSK